MDNCLFIVFGATGDLSKRKLIPALYKFVQHHNLDQFALLGVARNGSSLHDTIEQARGFISRPDETIIQKLKDHSYFCEIDFDYPADFEKLSAEIERIESERSLRGNRLIYLAVPPHYFASITQLLGQTGIAVRTQAGSEVGWHRIVYEKPFGTNLASAQEINRVIANWFDEAQIFRVDHYLTKELVGNIAMVRFTNIIFEPLWNSRYIDYVEIIMAQELGLSGRGAYYDQYGVLKDVVQNHMLQLLSLVAMEQPIQLSSDAVRDKKAEVLSHVQVTDGVLGQYKRYRREKGVASNSSTPTFALLRMSVNTPRWQGVPFYGLAGKRLATTHTVINIVFKDIACPLTGTGKCAANRLSIEIAPDSAFVFDMNVKAVGKHNTLMPVQMEFCHSCLFGPATPEAYELLLENIIQGDGSVSVRSDEIEASWSIYQQMENLSMPLYEYASESCGPVETEQFYKKYKVRLTV